ncbi:MFS transporter [Myceligenerans pegani]|uniref:MFS transporter n=1 Tax=Myceligenerans pegani TaxID=2776917 RepID=A0ABR9MTW8_9MICO|nr:MFS transporter [Myceligenerans sp. TRM 65318]MBE1874343.1 MFS transporter [Myceligenerans sp. TRM 65318]MBE3016614.1 MFS transporter [Myceligenerans sp. TRM 65318]
MTPAAARRVLLSLGITRWFPVGLVVGVTTLLPIERGLSVADTLTVVALTGLVVFALELPTSGFADAFGRRPVYLAAAAAQIVAAILFVTAQTFWGFVVAAAAFGVFRALDSGPLEAWYVDTVHRTRPGADVDRTLSAAGTVLGGSIAAGALVGGALIWWHPVVAWNALTLPYVVYAALACVHLVAAAVLMKEPRPAAAAPGSPGAKASLAVVVDGAREAPRVVRDGLRLLGTNRVLLGLVLVEVFWSFAMIVFETFQPIRLAELLGSEEAAGAVNGPVTAVGWAVFACGSALAGLASGRLGVARTAILSRGLNGAGAVVMGLVAGPAALVVAYLATYGLHGSAGPMHAALLHREAEARNRATVLSMNSMVAFGAFSLGAILLGRLADVTSNQTAMVVGGAVSVLGALCYLPALRREKRF